MSARPIFDDAMRLEDRIFLRVSAPVAAICKRLAQQRGVGASSIARDLIMEGCHDGGVPAIVPGPYRDPLNVAFSREQREMIDEAVEAESLRIGQMVDKSAYARRCLHRAIEMMEERPARRKAG